MNNKKNSIFTIVDFPKDGQTYGEFEGNIPKKVANDAFSTLIQFIDIDNSTNDVLLGKFIVFVIKNTQNGKLYKYMGSRIKLKNPLKINVDGSEKIYKYKNVIGRYDPKLDSL